MVISQGSESLWSVQFFLFLGDSEISLNFSRAFGRFACLVLLNLSLIVFVNMARILGACVSGVVFVALCSVAIAERHGYSDSQHGSHHGGHHKNQQQQQKAHQEANGGASTSVGKAHASEKVVIAGYGPPGVAEAFNKWTKKFSNWRPVFQGLVYGGPDSYSGNQTISDLRDSLRALSGTGRMGLMGDGDPITEEIAESYVDIPSHPDTTLSYVISPMLTSKIDDELYPDLLWLPMMASAVVIAYNIPEVPQGQQLNLSWKQLAGIFTGKISSWSDPQGNFAENNDWYAKSPLSDKSKNFPISIGVDSRWSYDTFQLVTQFSADGFGEKIGWPAGLFFIQGFTDTFKKLNMNPMPEYFEGKNADEYLGGVKKRPYSIGLGTLREAMERKLSVAAIESRPYSRKFISPSKAELMNYMTIYGIGDAEVPSGDVYPLTFIYSMVIKARGAFMDKPRSCSKTSAAIRFYRWVATKSENFQDIPFADAYAGSTPDLYAYNRQKLKQVTCVADVNSEKVYNVWDLLEMDQNFDKVPMDLTMMRTSHQYTHDQLSYAGDL